jgi:hypothetical protein
MSDREHKSRWERFGDPGYAATIGISQAVVWFLFRNLKHGFPTTGPDVLDAATFAAFQLALPFLLCFAYRRLARHRAAEH